MDEQTRDITTCAWCGQRAVGFAFIGDERYCHDGSGITCYMIASIRGVPKGDVLRAVRDAAKEDDGG